MRLARISGTIVDSRGRVASDTLVILNAARPDRALLTSTNMAEAGADGRFTLSKVAPGEYRLDVRAKREIEAIAKSGTVGQPQGADAAEFASLPLTITGEDIDGLRVAAAAGYQMSGRVTVEGVTALDDVLQRMRVGASEVTAGVGLTATMLSAGAPVQADGTFRIRGLIGTRVVRVSGLPAGWVLKKVETGGIDVTDVGVSVTADVEHVDIVISSRPTQLSGIVRHEDGTAAGNVAVVIFPVDRTRWTAPLNRFVTTVRSGADGGFVVKELPPASYYVTAVRTLIDGEWAEVDSLERLSEHATKISLAEGQMQSAVVRVAAAHGR